MTIADAIRAMNARKASAVGDPNQERVGGKFSDQQQRAVLVGLDLDVDELEQIAASVSTYAFEMIGCGHRPDDVLSTLVYDMLVAGVYFERERSAVRA